MHVLGLSHIGIAAKDPKQARKFFELLFSKINEESVAHQQTHTVMYDTNDQSPRIELLEDIPSETSQVGPIRRFLEKKGGGIHHLAIKVDDISKAIKFCEQHNIERIDENYKIGAHGSKTLFIHPRATGGVLIEFVEERAV